jgi:hypothetical protein
MPKMALSILTLLLLATTVHPLFSAPLPCTLYPDTNCLTRQKQCCIENFKLTPCTCVESFDSFVLTRRSDGEISSYAIHIDRPKKELIDRWLAIARACFPYYSQFDAITSTSENLIKRYFNRELSGDAKDVIKDVCPLIADKVKRFLKLDLALP